jgi:hypothetical protein
MQPDIDRYIVTTFDAPVLDEARGLLRELNELLGSGDHSKVLRRVLFLANGDLDKLWHYTGAAMSDWRDVIYWAEYDREDRRIRDFNQLFG